MTEKTRRELLSEAFDRAEKEDADDDVVVSIRDEENEPGGEEATDEQNLHGSGDGEQSKSGEGEKSEVKDSKLQSGQRGVDKKKEKQQKPAATEEERQEAEAARRDAEGKTGEERSSVTDKAPNSWKPGVREHWAKIPPEARAEITRREREIQTTLSQTANVRKFAGDFAAVINPFAHLIRSQHSTPLQAVQNLMTTAAGLMTGNQVQKAAIVAEIIQNYGVDVMELDGVLDAIAKKNGGRIPNRGQAQREEHVPTWARPLIEQNQRFQQLQSQHEEQMRVDADEEIAKVENEPYFDDLRDDVADIMEIAANRGRKMTVKQAYEKAVELNPEIRKLVAQHRLKTQGSQNRQVMSRARRAASSVSGAPSSGRSVGKPSGEKMTRKQQLAQAWEDAEDR